MLWILDFEVDPYIVRGLDYYSKTVFEVYKNGITFAVVEDMII